MLDVTPDATLLLLALASVAALAAAGGAIPLVGREGVPLRWIGWANALAAGLMLGAAYALVSAGLTTHPVAGAAGGVAGVSYVALTHLLTRTENLDLNRLQSDAPIYPYQVLMVHVFHSASEGVAIGVAMAIDIPFGVFMVLAIAVHNVPEATVLCAILRGRGLQLHQAAGLAVAARLSQVLLAVATYAIVGAAPTVVPVVLGLAVGALVYLVMAELLPESYRESGPQSIALVTIVALLMLVLLHARVGR